MGFFVEVGPVTVFVSNHVNILIFHNFIIFNYIYIDIYDIAI